MDTLITVIIIFGLLVTFHEFGHLIFAKRAGILCREFAIGFGPKLFSVKKGETVYTVRLLPIGGYVRMAGEDPEIVEIKRGQRVGLIFNQLGNVKKIIINHLSKYPDARLVSVESADLEHRLAIKGYETEDSELTTYELDRAAEYVMDEQGYQIAPYDRQFGSKSIWARFWALFAGPLMNFILAFLAFVLYFMLQGVPVDEPVLGKIKPDTPADAAGFHQGDEVKKINGETVGSWKEMSEIISKHPGDPLTFVIERNGQSKTLQVTPEERPQRPEYGMIGVYQASSESFLGSISHGFYQTFNWIKLELQFLQKLFTGEIGINSLAGPVGIYNITGEVVDRGYLNAIHWTAILSINLAIINLLPLPALDGGRLFFLFVEGIRGKPLDPQREAILHFVGFAFLMLLMIVVTWNDIQRIFLN